MTTFDLENSLGCYGILGFDEAGCGPWAGPAVAACVHIPPELYNDKGIGLLNDSKKLSHKKRMEAYAWITQFLPYGIGAASVREIDTLNIAKATALAMHRALGKLTQNFAHLPLHAALVDGIRNPKLPIQTHMVVGGDGKSCSIAAASIIAKVMRDRLMERIGKRYPSYGFEKNAGYGTKRHQEGLSQDGITPHHRLSYAPIKKLLGEVA